MSNLSYMKRVMMLVLPTDWSPRKTSLYLARGDTVAIFDIVGVFPKRFLDLNLKRISLSLTGKCWKGNTQREDKNRRGRLFLSWNRQPWRRGWVRRFELLYFPSLPPCFFLEWRFSPQTKAFVLLDYFFWGIDLCILESFKNIIIYILN